MYVYIPGKPRPQTARETRVQLENNTQCEREEGREREKKREKRKYMLRKRAERGS